MYLIQIDYNVFDGWTDGTPFTLVEALQEVRGVGNARIMRDDAAQTTVVRNAGSDTGPLVHEPTGRRVHRRKATGPVRGSWRRVRVS